MELEFDVHVDANALYDYMLRHTFTKAAGILGSTAGALGIVAGMMQRYPIYVIFGAVVLLYQPVSLWLGGQKTAPLPGRTVVSADPIPPEASRKKAGISAGRRL